VRRIDLASDCAQCAALCCVATCFDAGEDFAIDKRASERCMHLADDHRCTIHGRLVERGFRGCVAYECYGAGPRVTHALAATSPRERYAAFLSLRVVHELFWLLVEARKRCVDDALHRELDDRIDVLARITERDALDASEDVLKSHHDATHALLRRVGDTLRAKRALRVVRGQ